MLVLLSLHLGCSEPGEQNSPTSPSTTAPTPTVVPTTTPLPTIPVSAREAFEQKGFVVQDGAMVFSTMEGCCEPDANCWGNNPSTPYGAHAVPSAPGQPPRDDALLEAFGPVPQGMSRDFLLRDDEALVWVGTMPPEARYFGYRSYLGKRPGENHAIIGSLGPSLNHRVIEERRGAPGWGEPMAVVTTADALVEAEVIEALVQAGWRRDDIHPDRLPPGVVNLGLDPARHDTLFTVTRVAVYDDPEAGAAWEADPGEVYRLTPSEERELAVPHEVQPLPERGDGDDESAWEEAFVALADAVADAHQHPDGLLRPIVPYWAETIECIESGRSCTGDLRDRYVGISPYFVLPTDDSFLVSFGVNHERTGSATYSSVSIQTIDNQRGIASFDSRAMVGSARDYLDLPLVDDLYVVVWARDCSGFAGACVEVPWDCPGGGASEVFKITARAYLEPTTGAAPLPEEMLDDMVYLVIPSSEESLP
jgi:hypothetical protein